MLPLVVLVLVGTVLGDDPAPCCYSNQFRGIMMQTGATLAAGSMTPEIQSGYLMIDYDYNGKKVLMDAHYMDQNTGKLGNISIFEDFTASMRYTMYPGGCKAERMPNANMQEGCVPGNFTFRRTYGMGAGTNMLKVNVFEGMVSGQMITIHVTATDCVPVVESLFGDTGSGKMISSYVFGDLITGNAVVSTFTLPDVCKQGSAPVGKRSEREEEMISLLSIFR